MIAHIQTASDIATLIAIVVVSAPTGLVFSIAQMLRRCTARNGYSTASKTDSVLLSIATITTRITRTIGNSWRN